MWLSFLYREVPMYKIADAHSDFLSFNTLTAQDTRLFDHADAERMIRGGVALQVLAVWVPAEHPEREIAGLTQMRYLESWLQNRSDIRLCTLQQHLNSSHALSIILAIESGESIDCRIENIQNAYRMGARMLSLTWNNENAFASGCMCEGGLKPAGFAAVHELNRLNMALDVSHINEQGFWEAVESYKGAPCASHSCVSDLCSVPRNLKRNQISHIISSKGYIGINFYTEFLRGRFAQINDILDHIEYVLTCGGEDNVGFGSDFCGIQYTPDGLDSVADFQKLPEAMLRRGYSDELVKKICYGNFARYVLEFLH